MSTLGVMILTHGRAGHVITDKTLRKAGFTGPIHYIVDDGDEDAETYRFLLGEDVVHIFSKDEEEALFDTGDLSTDRGTIVYARNASQRIAKELGWYYLWQLDDDYTSFEYRHPHGSKLLVSKIRDLDAILRRMITFMERTNALTVAMGQGGDLIGGVNSNFRAGLLRKAMNSFIIRTDRPVGFLGRINEDVNTYVACGNRGELFFTIMDATLTQKRTQTNEGGMTTTYLDGGTYTKSFHTVMRNPSSVKVAMMTTTHSRMHHAVEWKRTVPMILHRKWKKGTRS